MHRCLLFVLLVVIPVGARCDATADERNRLFRAAVGNADRLTISDTAGHLDEKGQKYDPGPLTIIEGPGAASGFLAHCSFSGAPASPPCLCSGDVHIRFYRGSDVLAELYIHSGWYIEWVKGPSSGMLPLDDGSKKEMRKWLAAHGAAREVSRINDQIAVPSVPSDDTAKAQGPQQ